MKKPKPHYYDGMRMGDPDGRIYRVFEPRWWQLGRWLLLWRYRFWQGFVEPVLTKHTNIVSGKYSVRVRIVSCVRIK